MLFVQRIISNKDIRRALKLNFKERDIWNMADIRKQGDKKLLV
jgi:hypothetical protein